MNTEPKVIALAGQKGGSGKTTTAICLAAEWHARQRRVLLVDADPQGSSRTWADVAAEAKRPVPTVVSMGSGFHRPDQLPTLARAYEFTLIDCPARHGEIQRAALMVADLVVIPCGPAAVEAWALAATVDIVAEARTLRPDLLACVLVTRKPARTVVGKQVREVLSTSGLQILDSELGSRVAFMEVLAAGEGVSAYAPGTPAAAEISALADEIEGLLFRENAHVAA